MLVEFIIKNFKCIRDEQTLSLVSTAKQDKFAFSTNHKLVSKLLPVAGVFGANASGKSTVTEAIEFLHFFVLTSHEQSKNIKVMPFVLDDQNRENPSEFEITFIQNNTLYRYGFAVDAEQVHEEWLYMTPKEGRINEVFTRQFNKQKEEYDWSINDKLIKGPKSGWKQMTNQKALFLSVVMHFRDETSKSVHNIIFEDTLKWFKKKLYTLQQDQMVHSNYTAELFEKKDPLGKKILKLLKNLDFDVENIYVKENKIPDSILETIPQNLHEQFKFDFQYEIKFSHLDKEGKEVRWDIKNESGGTQKLFCLAGPIMETLDSGGVFVVDELHNNFHPRLLEAIISLFQNSEINKNHAQLIFTSHDVTAMNPDILNKDQVWFADKKKDKSTSLVPLAIFKPREGAIYSKSYMEGRYGALPNIKELTSL